MGRFGKIAFLVLALYAATIVVASYHHHHANTEHLNCKLCQISSESSIQVVQTKAPSDFYDFGKLPEFELLGSRSEFIRLGSGRAPPTDSL